MTSKAFELAKLGNAYSDGALSNRNLIINGAMQVAQRGTSQTGITGGGGTYTSDRFLYATNIGTTSHTTESDAPSGFSKSLKIEVTTAETPVSSGDLMLLEYRLEGQDLQQLKKGTSDAIPITVSFWVKSNKTGTYILEIDDNDNSRNINQAYTISASGVWEYKTLTFDGDVSGAFDDDSGHSARLIWWLDAGSSFRSGTLQTSWASTNNSDRVVGNVALGDTVGNYFQITGVQLEVGDTATPFEHEPYGVTLQKCQRYYQKIGYDGGTNVFGAGSWYTSTNAYGYMSFLQTMRAAPTITAPTASNGYKCYTGGSTALASTLNFARVSNKTARIGMVTSGGTTGYGTWFELNGVSPCNVIMDAEL